MKLFDKFRRIILFLLLVVCTSVTAQKQFATNKKLDSMMKIAWNEAAAHNFLESFKLAKQVKEIAIESNETYYIALADNLVAGAHIEFYDYSNAIDYTLRSIVNSTIIKDSNQIALGHANLAHTYMLIDEFDKSNEHIKKAKEIDDKNKYNTKLYIYETTVMSLYKQGLYDSLVKVSRAGLQSFEDRTKKNLSDSNFRSNEWKELMRERIRITFELYIAYGLFETNKELELANNLLNKHKDKKLEKILYASVRIYKNYYRINVYKERYFLNQPVKNQDSIQYYKKQQEKYFYAAIDFLKKSSRFNTEYMTQTVENENQMERLKLISENRAKEIQFNRKISYLLGFLMLLALAFVWYYKKANSKIKKVNASLDQANLELKQLYLNNDKFLAVVSNEIRTPLYSLEQLIASVPIYDYEMEDELMLANYSLINLRHSINNSLQYSQLNYFNSEKELNNQPVDLKDLLSELNLNFRSILIVNNVNLKIIYEGDNYIFKLERSKLALVLSNLMKNAIEKDNVTQVEIKVVENPIGERQSLLLFSVSDNAEIINQEDIDYIERGKLIIEKEQSAENGIKMGLILSNQLLALYNSKLKFSGNQELNVVSFEIKLSASSKVNFVEKKTNTKKQNILYVNNNQLHLLLFKEKIGALDYAFDTVSFNKSLTKITEKEYAVILIDIDNQKEEDCCKDIRELKKHKKLQPIIAISSLSKTIVLEQYKECAFNDVVTKPVNINKLSQILANYI